MELICRSAPWLLLITAGALMALDVGGGPDDLGRLAALSGIAALLLLHQRRTAAANELAARANRILRQGGGGQHRG